MDKSKFNFYKKDKEYEIRVLYGKSDIKECIKQMIICRTNCTSEYSCSTKKQ